jgi:hypothetical protein
MAVKDDRFNTITAEEFWDELMSVDDFVELMLANAPTKSIDVREDAVQCCFSPKFINKISTHV